MVIDGGRHRRAGCCVAVRFARVAVMTRETRLREVKRGMKPALREASRAIKFPLRNEVRLVALL